MSQRSNRKPGGSIRCSTFSGEPVRKLSRQTTSTPLSRRCSQRWEPRNPAPPVTTARRIVRGPRTGVGCGIAAPLSSADVSDGPYPEINCRHFGTEVSLRRRRAAALPKESGGPVRCWNGHPSGARAERARRGGKGRPRPEAHPERARGEEDG